LSDARRWARDVRKPDADVDCWARVIRVAPADHPNSRCGQAGSADQMEQHGETQSHKGARDMARTGCCRGRKRNRADPGLQAAARNRGVAIRQPANGCSTILPDRRTDPRRGATCRALQLGIAAPHDRTIGGFRAYDIALEAISHGDGRVDTDSLIRSFGLARAR
jgi:hypothetical protein